MIGAQRFLTARWPWVFCSAVFALAIIVLASLAFGAVPTAFADVFSFIAGASDPQHQMILRELRLPRALLALCVGGILASSGAMTQGLFRNPLADPSLIGVTAGAAAGASVAIVLLDAYHWDVWGLSLVSLGAFVGGCLAVIFVYRIATGDTGTSVATMLLAGIAVTFLAGSVSSLLEFVADNDMLRRISLWRMGGLEAADDARLIIIAAVVLGLIIWVPRQYAALNALLLGESEARHLGVGVAKAKRNIVLMVAAGVGVSVALAGTISFIGLVVPHMVRIVIGPNHRYVIPLSAILGGILLIVADAFARSVIAPTELPVGLVTAFIGAPVFISLLRQRHRYGMQ